LNRFAASGERPGQSRNRLPNRPVPPSVLERAAGCL
jgi:hypothetical protein